VKGVPVRRSSRRSGDSQHDKDTRSAKSGKTVVVSSNDDAKRSSSRRKRSDSQQQSDAKSTRAVKVDVVKKTSAGRRKRKLEDDKVSESSKRDINERTSAAKATKRNPARNRKSDNDMDGTINKIANAPNRGRSTQRRSHETTAPVAKSRSRSSKRQREGAACKEPKISSRSRDELDPSTTSLPMRTRSKPRSRTVATHKQAAFKPKVLCVDFLQHTDYSLVREPFDGSKFTFGVAVHDEAKRHDVLEVSDYVTDIFQRLYYEEVSIRFERSLCHNWLSDMNKPAMQNLTRPRKYVQNQPHLNAMMRAILVDWIVEVHMKFRLSSPTLYLCINIIDRYLNLASVERENLQLVGVTALLIACKYEEIYPPEVRDCVYITDRAYTRQDVLDMEQEIVKRLEFKMTVPTGYPFLQRFLAITDASETIGMAANYYMERVLQEHEMLEYRPSLVAAAAVCLAMNNPDLRVYDRVLDTPKPGWVSFMKPNLKFLGFAITLIIFQPNILLKHTGFAQADICEVAEKICLHVPKEVTTQSGRELIAVKRKYEADKYNQVAIRFHDPEIEDISSDPE
jgi:cyclin B